MTQRLASISVCWSEKEWAAKRPAEEGLFLFFFDLLLFLHCDLLHSNFRQAKHPIAVRPSAFLLHLLNPFAPFQNVADS